MNSIFARVSIRKYQDRPVEKLKPLAILYGYPGEERKQLDRFDESRIHYGE